MYFYLPNYYSLLYYIILYHHIMTCRNQIHSTSCALGRYLRIKGQKLNYLVSHRLYLPVYVQSILYLLWFLQNFL